MSYVDLDDIHDPNKCRDWHKTQCAMTQDVAVFCRQKNWSLSFFYKTVWAIVLNRYTESQEVTFAVQTDNSTNATQICNVSVEPETSIIDLLTDKPGLITLANSSEGKINCNTGLLIEEDPGHDEIAQRFPEGIQVLLVARVGQPREAFIFHTLGLSEWHAENLASTVERVIGEITKDPHQPVKDLDLFSTRNHQHVSLWNERTFSKGSASMIDIIREHSAQRPTQEAVCAWDGTLTYAELDDLTTRFARRLIQMGVKEDGKVLLCFEKSMWVIVSFLAVLKAGGVFVPVSPSYPTERLKGIIDATRPRLVLTSPEFTTLFEPFGVESLPLSSSTLSSLSTVALCEEPLPPTNAKRAAYVLFTSGSTGRPKGCILEHQGMAMMRTQGPGFHIHPTSRVLQFAPFIFAGSSVDTFLPLLVGGTVCIASQHDLMNNVADAMRRLKVTWACMTPSTISAIEPSQLSGLETLVLVGEPVGENTLNKWSSSVTLLSGYGLSEIVGAGCVSILKPGSHARNIGHSPTAKIWLADPANHERLAPVGAIGEMLIDGPNIGRGYLDDPERTAGMFPEAPEWIHKFYPEQAPHRVLKSGDLARYQPDGSLVYIGRKDTQVKIRGKRVELGEIEYHIRLQRHADEVVIVEAVCPQDGDGTRVLISFIYSPGDEEKTASFSSLLGSPSLPFQMEVTRLNAQIRAALPDFMVPSIYLPLARIPKTASGKTDRRALRLEIERLSRLQLEAYMDADDRPRVQPRTEDEILLHQLFSQVLNRSPDTFGIHEKFLRMGGDSIKAMRLINLCGKSGLVLMFSDIMESGSVAELAGLIQKKSKKNERLAKKINEGITTSMVDEQLLKLGVQSQDVEVMQPCSSMQEGILISQLRSPDQYALRVIYEVNCSQQQLAVDIDRLQKAWNRLTQYHAMLRTMFVTNISPDLFAAQVQLKQGALPSVHHIDDDSELQETLNLGHERQSIHKMPQFTLYTSSNGKVFANFKVSHAAVDGMSMSIIIRDLCKLYDGWKPSDLSFNYVDYVDYLQNTSTSDSRSYWKEYLNGFDSCQFPTNKSDISTGGARGDSQFKAVPVDIWSYAEYKAFAQTTGITMANVVKLAWTIVLRIFTHTEDVCFGYLTAGRDAPIEDILDAAGPFINILPFRPSLKQGSAVMSALKSIQSDYVRCLPRQGVSLGDIRRAVGVAGDEVLFNTCVSHFPVLTGDAGKSSITLHEMHRVDPTEFDLNVEVMDFEDQIKASIKGYTGVVPLEQMEQVASVFGHIMQTIIRNPDQEIGRLDLLPNQDKEMIRHWNKEAPQPVNRCIQQLIVEQCQTNPSAPAVCAWDGDWTYGEMDQKSSSLARRLQLQGVAADTFVPVLMNKSRWVPIALLGILKAGGAFVLLEPSLPMQRLQDVCADLQSSIIITLPESHETAAALVPNVLILGDGHVVDCDSKELNEDPKVEINPSHAAYAVFTSGSTGKPKGAVVEHHSLSTLASAIMRQAPLTKASRVFQYCSFSFDVSVQDLIVTLVAGACLCIPSPSARQNRLLETINDFQTTNIALTPTVARTLQPEKLTTLKALYVSGEALSSSEIQRWSTTPHIQLINMYGPAECTVNVTACSSPDAESPANIGHAMCNSTTWVVDPKDHHVLAPIGTVGELVIQGPAVGREYLNRREQTAVSFVSPPGWLSQYRTLKPNEKLYKTGDLVQYAKDGSLIYKGRKDCQVKLRGQRFELAEVEEHLRRAFPDASDVIAEIAVLKQGNTKALAAFIYQTTWDSGDGLPSPRADNNPDLEFLQPSNERFDRAVAQAREKIVASIPSYMEPTIYIPLAQIPKSRSGKTDRGRLRQIISSGIHEQWTANTEAASTRRAPRNERESVLCSSVAEVLSLSEQEIGAEDNFFRRGGDSVAAMMLVAVVRQKGYDLTVAEIFENPRLDILSENMKQLAALGETSTVPPPFSLLGDDASSKTIMERAMNQCMLTEEYIDDIYSCTPLQTAFFLYSRGRQGSLISTWVHHLQSAVDIDRLRNAWNDLNLAHPILRTRIIQDEATGSLHQVVLHHATELEYYNSPENTIDYVPDLPIEIASGKPLLRMALVRNSPSSADYRLILSLHHSVYDGWALVLLMQELDRAYSGARLQYRPFSAFVSHLAQGQEATADFWRQEMKDLKASIFPQLPSPTYKPDPHAVMTRRVTIPPVQSPQFTVSTKVRWAWTRLISLYTDNPDTVIMLGTAGRGTPIPGIEKMIAPILAIFPHRVWIDQSQAVVDALREAQHHYSQTLPHEHYGTPNICRVATGPTSPATFQTLLVIQPQQADSDFTLFTRRELLPQTSAFHVRGLSLHIYLQNSSMEVVACYDNQVIPDDEMARILDVFDLIFQQICHEPIMRVGQLETVPSATD